MLELAIASSEVKTPATHEFKGTKIQVLYGDHQPFMQALADNMQADKASSKASSRLVVKLQLVVKLVVSSPALDARARRQHPGILLY
jgi:hypothetical protein